MFSIPKRPLPVSLTRSSTRQRDDIRIGYDNDSDDNNDNYKK